MDSLNFNSVIIDDTLSYVPLGGDNKMPFDIVKLLETDDTLSYVPWGGDNKMPFDILKLIEDDETLSTCQMFNAVVFVQGTVPLYKKLECGEVGGVMLFGRLKRKGRGADLGIWGKIAIFAVDN